MDIKEVIEKRRTTKVLSNEPWPLPESNLLDSQVNALIKSAEMAPFHYQSHKLHQENGLLNSPVPWRVHILKAGDCRKLATYLVENEVKAGKILQMLNAANALLYCKKNLYDNMLE